jgi:hypothetical protein
VNTTLESDDCTVKFDTFKTQPVRLERGPWDSRMGKSKRELIGEIEALHTRNQSAP